MTASKLPNLGFLPALKPKGRPGGIYNAHLLELLHELKLAVWLESSVQIKQAGGMQRGKPLRRPGDKVDAQRIAQYAYGTGHPALSRPNAPLAGPP